MPPEAAAFIGALVSGLLASLAEVKLTYPRIALTVPSIVIMVPGLYLYRSMYYMCTFDTVNMLGWFVRAVLIVGVSARWLGRGANPHRPSLAPHQLIGARGQVTLYQMSCGEIGTELLLKGSKQSVFHRNLWGRGIIGALHLHKLNAYEARAFRARLVTPHK